MEKLNSSYSDVRRIFGVSSYASAQMDFIEFDLFVRHLGFYIGNFIDLGIEIVPTKKLQSKMSSGPGYFERVIHHIARQGRRTPAVPLILIGVEP